ncbi:CPBP family intramembrane glutamic endopeptidase [Ureibacillus manganicus]|uniref:CAAX protease n=1 Tax=Ureibacillus manganicus DSM 26584 TaxID=1384049 RepID=A0A0A3I058_9BACL|nr:type II CAAX endopeptidase family protein [Ureibacillus manganicus]KGR76885.1 CAAX protease [Ureibacillus manganicus DSM 26584]
MSQPNKLKTQATAFYILILYIVCQLSGLLLFIPGVRDIFLQFIDREPNESGIVLVAWWSTIAFAITFIVSFIIISRNKNFWNVYKGEKSSIGESIGWGILGFFLVLVGQTVAVNIELALGITLGSQNTETIIKVTEIAPIMILSTVLFAPILEELVFRRVVFGSIIQTQNFWIAGLISAIVFATIHNEFTHILIYAVSGFIFAFLYYKTKRLLTSIISHMLLNGFVTIAQIYGDEIQNWVKEIQTIIVFIQ